MNHYFVICDEDGCYTQRLAEYMAGRKVTYMNIESFTNLEMAMSFCKTNRVHYLLIHEDLYTGQGFPETIPHVFFLSENPKHTSGQHIYKYQSAEQILKQILGGESGQEAELEGAPGSRMNKLCVYSPVRRASTTSFALALAQQLAEQHKTLYLNLCAFSGVEEYLGKSGGPDLSDMMYFVQTGQGLEKQWNEETILHWGRVDYVEPMQSFRDLQSVSAEHWESFFQMLEERGGYEYLIVEMDETIPDFLVFLNTFQWVFTPVASDVVGKRQFLSFEQQLQEEGKSEIRQRMRTFLLPELPAPENHEAAVEQLGGPLRHSATKLLEKTIYAE